MVEPNRQARLPQQALAEALISGEIRADHLERDGTVEPPVMGEVDLSHPAAADQFLDLVGVEQLVHRRILLHPGSPCTGRTHSNVAFGRQRAAGRCQSAGSPLTVITVFPRPCPRRRR
jgi:hypothetical protein